MSGHSKWHNIQAKKGKADAQRGAVFTKIGREIAIAVREGGANPESNGKLRDIIAKAKANKPSVKAAPIRNPTANCGISSPRPRPTICRMIIFSAPSKRPAAS